MSLTNPNHDRLIEIQNQVVAAYMDLSPTRFFDVVNVTQGKQMIQRKFAKMPHVPRAVVELVEHEVEKLQLGVGTFRIFRIAEKFEFSSDEYHAAMAEGELLGAEETLARAVAAGVAEAVFQSSVPTIGSADNPYYGIIDAGTGNGTFSRPLSAGAGTKLGAWSTATYMIGDNGQIIGKILQFKAFNDGTPLVLFQPAIVEVTENQGLPGVTTGEMIKPYLKKLYGVIEDVPDARLDPAGTGSYICLLTGAVETATNFELVLCNPNWFLEITDQAPKVFWTNNDDQTKFWLHLEVHVGVMPIPYQHVDGKVYKAMSYIDTCGA